MTPSFAKQKANNTMNFSAKRDTKETQMKGKTYTKIFSARSIDHLDPTSDQHKKDQAEFRKVRVAEKALNWMEDSVGSYLLSEKFRSLGDGLMLDPAGQEIYSQEHKHLIRTAAKERAFYWQYKYDPESGEILRYKNGNPIRRRIRKINKKPIKPIRQIAVTFRPDHSLALHIIDQKAKREESLGKLRKFIKVAALETARSFCEDTNYDLIAIEVHAKEGCLHFHLVFSTISAENELLHISTIDEEKKRRKKGNPDIRRAGPCQVALERTRTNGIPIQDEENHLFLLKDKVRQGDLPADIKASQVLDGYVEKFQRRYRHSRVIFNDCFERWRKARIDTLGQQLKKSRKGPEVVIDESKFVVGGMEIETWID